MTKITRKFTFDAGHRIFGHESKCNNLHGHRYEVEVSVQGSYLDNLGRVVDFGVLKTCLGKWIDDNLDHRMILAKNDPTREMWRQLQEKETGSAPFIMNVPPTAENIAALIYTVAALIFAERTNEFVVTEVIVHETANCWASYNGPTQTDIAPHLNWRLYAA